MVFLAEVNIPFAKLTPLEIALLKAAKVLWHSVITSAGSTLTWEEASQQHRDMAIEHARRAIMTYLDNAKPRG